MTPSAKTTRNQRPASQRAQHLRSTPEAIDQSEMQNLDPSTLYLLTPRIPSNGKSPPLYIATNTTILPSPEIALSTSSDIASIDNNGARPLNFTIKSNSSLPGHYNICTDFFSTPQVSLESAIASSTTASHIGALAICLDQWGNNASQPALQGAGGFTGQQWSVVANYEAQEGQTY